MAGRLEGTVARITGQQSSLWGLVAARAARTPDLTMAVDESGASLTFGELLDQAERAARRLEALGIGVGTRVAWQLPTRIDTLVLIAALARLGAVQIPLLPIYRQREVGFILQQAQPEVFIVVGTWRGFDHLAMAHELAGSQAGGLTVIEATPALWTGAPTEPLPPFTGPAGDTVRWVFYTSGTTGDPKGVQHTDASVLAAGHAMAFGPTVTSADRVPLVFPVSHVGGVLWISAILMTGCRALVVETFDPERTIDWLDAQGMTLGAGGTIFVVNYLARQRLTPDTPVLQDVRVFLGGAAPKPPDLYDQLLAEIGAPLLSAYGMTECPILSCSRLDDPVGKLRTTEGVLSPGAQARVVDVDGVDQPAGAEGELLVRGPQLFVGYLDATLNDAAFDDGWFRTGDLGAVDDDGQVTITGRIKDIIIRKGENISAKEVEDLVRHHPNVSDVSVVGLPDPEVGERCCAVVVPVPGTTMTLAEVVAHLRAGGLMAQKLPERLELVDELPRNATGKVLKQALRAQFTEPTPR